VVSALLKLGRDLSIARKRRRISQLGLATRLGVCRETIIRLEHGDRRVNVGVLAGALAEFGMIDRISVLVDPHTDRIGISNDVSNLPQRVREGSGDTIQAEMEAGVIGI
jgi:transcriptional regulator with XRE-family HTH domain